MKKSKLTGKTSFVTGGSEGIGRSIALELASAGSILIINYVGDDRPAIETKNEIQALGQKCYLFKQDIQSPRIADLLIKFLDENSITIDILVANASVQVRKEWNQLTTEDFELQVNTNLRSTLLLTQTLFQTMKENGWGRILTIGSVQQSRPHPQMLIYAALKSAQVNLVKNLAVQFAPFGITINNLAPGVIATNRNKEVLLDENYKQQVIDKIPVGYIGNPVDIAPIALLLCSDEGKYITGQDIFVDGGMNLNK